MRYRKPKNKKTKERSASVQAGSETLSEVISKPSRVEISDEENRALSFIRRDVTWSACVVLLVIVAFVVVGQALAKEASWSDFAEKLAKSAGLIK